MGLNTMMAEFAGQIATELDEFCRSTLDRAQVEPRPDDIFALADRLGIEIVVDHRASQRARCVRLRRGAQSRWLLVLQSDARPERLQWAAAHELGETLAGEAASKLGWDIDDIQPDVREWLANEIAKRLLLPFPQFVTDGTNLGWDLLQLKGLYPNVSHEVIARRMLDAPPPVTITIFDNGRLYWRKSNQLMLSPTLNQQERRCWQAAHESGETARYEDPRQSIACWAVHEDGWRREIMRTQAAWIEW